MSAKSIWKGQLVLDDKVTLEGVQLSSRGNDVQPSLGCHKLGFLAFVDPTQIPLHLIQGPSLDVAATDDRTKIWLNRALIDEEALRLELTAAHDAAAHDFQPWHETDAEQSTVAVLAQPIDVTVAAHSFPRITEVLIYGERTRLAMDDRLPTPPPSSEMDGITATGRQDDRRRPGGDVCFRAIFLSSDAVANPLPTPEPLEPGDAIFVCDQPAPASAPNATSKKHLTDLFDEAADRRKKMRHHGGHSISAAASRMSEAPPPPSRGQACAFDGQSIKPESQDGGSRSNESLRRSVEAKNVQARRSSTKKTAPADTRPASHSSSTTRPLTAQQSQTAAHMTTPSFTDPTVDTKNRQTISRIVLAGMRLHGFQQRKYPAPSRTPAPKADAMTLDHPAHVDPDAEYKAVYHHTYKGTLFAFRGDLTQTLLTPDAIRDVVEKLLYVFCTRPPEVS